MQFKSLTLVALAAAGVSAQLDSLSVLSVLKTAIPAESISSAFADPSAFSAELASSLKAGNTPPWYQALPSDVKNALPQLYPATNVASTTAAYETPAPSSTLAPVSSAPLTTEAPLIPATTASISGSTAVAGNSTVISTVQSPTLSVTGGTGLPTSVETGAAPRMTAAIGAGIAGVFGLVGLLL